MGAQTFALNCKLASYVCILVWILMNGHLSRMAVCLTDEELVQKLTRVQSRIHYIQLETGCIWSLYEPPPMSLHKTKHSSGCVQIQTFLTSHQKQSLGISELPVLPLATWSWLRSQPKPALLSGARHFQCWRTPLQKVKTSHNISGIGIKFDWF